MYRFYRCYGHARTATCRPVNWCRSARGSVSLQQMSTKSGVGPDVTVPSYAICSPATSLMSLEPARRGAEAPRGVAVAPGLSTRAARRLDWPRPASCRPPCLRPTPARTRRERLQRRSAPPQWARVPFRSGLLLHSANRAKCDHGEPRCRLAGLGSGGRDPRDRHPRRGGHRRLLAPSAACAAGRSGDRAPAGVASACATVGGDCADLFCT